MKVYRVYRSKEYEQPHYFGPNEIYVVAPNENMAKGIAMDASFSFRDCIPKREILVEEVDMTVPRALYH